MEIPSSDDIDYEDLANMLEVQAANQILESQRAKIAAEEDEFYWR